MLIKFSGIVLLALFICNVSAVTAQNSRRISIESWVTNPDRSALFEKQTDTLFFADYAHGWSAPIVIDEGQQMQSIDGFGYALTGGSAELMMKMSAAERSKLIRELFASDSNNVGISYIRLSIGASDMNSFVFSYDDLPDGQTDFELKKFSLSQDLKDVVPVMKEIIAANPNIKILGSPWSAPTWMKSNGKVKGGSLKKDCYQVYAQYFIKYIQAMKKEGISIDAITIQNEPLNANNTPSMRWMADEEAEFIKSHLGPAFKKAGITSKIILFDHNCDRPDYPLVILNDPAAAQYVDGSGFHHYGGDMSALSIVHNARPDKNLYFTEQMTIEEYGKSTINIVDPVKTLIIGGTRNWSKNVLLWNLAADEKNNPHTNDGGCPMCQGAITISGDKVSRNVAFYTIAHASKFVVPGSVRIGSTTDGDQSVSLTEDEERPGVYRSTVIEKTKFLPNVAFKTPAGKIVLIVANDTREVNSFRVQYRGQLVHIKLKAGAVGTYIW